VMKNEKEEIDRLIEQALTKEEAEFYHKLDEQNIFEMVGGMFQGKMKWLTILTAIVQLIMTGFAFYFIYKFFTTNDMVQLIQFGAISFFFLNSVGLIKIFHWMEMNKNSMVREIKRMELQISVLASKLRSKQASDS
ncbi:MAG: DUF6768 family protein, partial [Bacteroidota bacterium]